MMTGCCILSVFYLFVCVHTPHEGGQPFGSRSFPTMDSRVGVLLPDEPSQQSDAALLGYYEDLKY